jgi:DNA-binding IscR family transcriptional regulator
MLQVEATPIPVTSLQQAPLVRLPERSLQCLAFLRALSGRTGPGQIAELAAELGLAGRRIEILALDLRRAGLVRSSPGRTGGYTLTRPASTITILEVVRASAAGAALPPSWGERGPAWLVKLLAQFDAEVDRWLGARTVADFGPSTVQ